MGPGEGVGVGCDGTVLGWVVVTVVSVQFTVKGTAVFTSSVAVCVLPVGLSVCFVCFLPGSGTPADVHTFPVTASSGVGSVASSPFAGTLAAVAPSVVTGTVPALVVGTVVSVQFTANGTPVSTFAVSAGVLPGGLSLSSAGLLTGTPTTARMCVVQGKAGSICGRRIITTTSEAVDWWYSGGLWWSVSAVMC